MSIHEWKTETCVYHGIQDKIKALQAEGFTIHTVSMDSAKCTISEWVGRDGSGYGSVEPVTYNVWVILATRDLPAPTAERSDAPERSEGPQ